MPELPQLDEDRDSRTIAALGREVLQRMMGTHVLVSGMDGLGCEIAKNVMLAGVKKLTIQDDQKTSWMDLSSQFYLRDTDIGKNRAAACKERLGLLNTTVTVNVIEEPLTTAHLEDITVAVFVGTPEAKLLEFNNFCRSKKPEPIKFIMADCKGVFGRCFCDFGDEFVVQDVNGENPHAAIITNISNANPAAVTCSQEEGIIELGEGEYVEFQDVEGMTELVGHAPVKVLETHMYNFKIDLDTTKFGKFKRENLASFTTCVERKMPKTLKFRSLNDCFQEPGDFLLTDFMKFDRSPQLHVGFRALEAYRAKHGKTAPPRDAAAFAEVLGFAKDIAKSLKDPLEEVQEGVLKKLVDGAPAVLMPMASIFGGIIGQEVMKAVSNKLHPLFQLMYMDCVEALPADDTPDADFVPEGNRYDGQVTVFGKTLQQKIRDLKYFIVGSGALGCELLKNFAMMGVASSDKGSVTLTDDDIIERSNLSRQFLFRNQHIGKSKSLIAKTSVQEMNPEFKVNALQERVQPASENIFDRKFWEGLDGVANALDNIKARRYVDQQVVYYQKSLLESGTMGTKCNMQVVIPHKTTNYGSRADPDTKEAPECALHNFPHNINHCLSLGRSEFIGRFTNAPANALKYIKDAAYVNNVKEKIWDKETGKLLDGKVNGLSNAQEANEELIGILECLVTAKAETFDDCVSWARLAFEEYFVNRIKQLVHSFPASAKNSTGGPFWAPPKRFPTALEFDAKDETHMRFIIAAANLKALTYGIPVPANNRDPATFLAALEAVKVPPFVPKDGLKIDTGDKNEKSGAGEPSGDAADQVKAALEQLPPRDAFKQEPFSNEFEKDDDTNHHMDFIGAFANLRARNYNIGEVDKLQAKLIAGRIIPALATTTSTVTGFVCLELVKLVQNKEFEQYRDLQANLALPEYYMYEPEAAKKMVPRTVKTIPDPINHPDYVEEEEIDTRPKDGYTVWDKILINKGDITVQDFIDFFKKEYEIECTSITCAISSSKAVIFYNPLFPNTKGNLTEKISALYQKHGGFEKSTGDTGLVQVECLFENDEGTEVETPTIVVQYHD
eukprot:TRINITY_DN55708_c0_g1_i1.p1 TRINITY_DN55708_c0_g1~~TRINITY_DN55708_c0_g1_i1.p1  ORF type:complete len:1093 (-),score=223.50 TRINITY_DN55708_c0_g1_i1:123-3329(-)